MKEDYDSIMAMYKDFIGEDKYEVGIGVRVDVVPT